jgi:hypothetical protein
MRLLVVAGVLASSSIVAADDRVELDDARALFPDAPATCADVPCLIEHAYAKDPKAKAIALALYRDVGVAAGVGPDELMDGGYRGPIHLVPQLPIHGYRIHLERAAASLRSYDTFFAQLGAGTGLRWHGIQLRFVRSVGKRTPSAYAMGRIIEYNVEGSLLTTEEGVRETLFHELFHSNDGLRGSSGVAAKAAWSARTLQADYDAIVKKCPSRALRCLAPYAPNNTTVRGGTYYAFQPDNGNGVHEYAAELAVRYWKEHRALLAKRKLAARPFKCGPPENQRAWKAVVDEFFAGRDLTPTC